MRLGQLRRGAAEREPPHLGRAEEGVRLLELGDVVQVGDRRNHALRVSVDRARGLKLETRLTAVEHQHRIERRRVDRGWNTAAQDDGARGRIAGELDVCRQRNGHQDRRIGEHPRHAVAKAVVAAVVHEERIVRVLVETLGGILRRHRTGVCAMAGTTRAAVAAERFVLEERPAVSRVAGTRPGALRRAADDSQKHGAEAREQSGPHSPVLLVK